MTERSAPRANGDTAIFWDGCDRRELLFQRCRACGRAQLPPRRFCGACHGSQIAWERSKGFGAVYSYTLVHRAPTAAFRALAPYPIALVDLDEGFRMMMNLALPPGQAPKVGQRVHIGFAETAETGRLLPQAEPLA